MMNAKMDSESPSEDILRLDAPLKDLKTFPNMLNLQKPVKYQLHLWRGKENLATQLRC
jgi:hypothetical protein